MDQAGKGDETRDDEKCPMRMGADNAFRLGPVPSKQGDGGHYETDGENDDAGQGEQDSFHF